MWKTVTWTDAAVPAYTNERIMAAFPERLRLVDGGNRYAPVSGNGGNQVTSTGIRSVQTTVLATPLTVIPYYTHAHYRFLSLSHSLFHPFSHANSRLEAHNSYEVFLFLFILFSLSVYHFHLVLYYARAHTHTHTHIAIIYTRIIITCA